jgi:hypothetical protein
MWWKKKPEPDEPPLRDQLIAARADLRRQIEIMEAGPVKYYPGAPESFQSQVAELRQIEEALAEMDRAERG